MKSYLICKSFTAKPPLNNFIFTDFWHQTHHHPIIPPFWTTHNTRKSNMFFIIKIWFLSITLISIVDYDGEKWDAVTLLSMMNKLFSFLYVGNVNINITNNNNNNSSNTIYKKSRTCERFSLKEFSFIFFHGFSFVPTISLCCCCIFPIFCTVRKFLCKFEKFFPFFPFYILNISFCHCCALL